MNNRLYNAFNRLEIKKQNKESLIPGLLGFMIGGIKTTEVQDRPGYVYVRLRNNTNEMITAFNDQVSPVYDLPVLVVRDEIDMSRYKIQGRDVGKYENWGSVSSYLPRHGNQHSFDPSSGGGGDVVWVYDKQLMPLALVPSGTAGAGNVTIGHDTIFQRTTWKSVGGTGTANLLAYKPTGTSARLVLVYLDQNGNPQTVLGSFFDASITGTAAIVPYLPYPPQTWDIPLGAVRLVSGTSTILWENIYDLRAILRDATTTGTSTQITIRENGVDQTVRNYLDFVGAAFDVYDNGSATVVSGTLPSIFPSITVTGDFRVSGTSTFNRAILQNVSTPSAPSAGYITIFSASGTPKAIDSGGNLYAMGRDFGVTGSLTFVPLRSPLSSTSFDGDPFTTTPKTLIDLSVTFGTPSNIRAIFANVAARDSASSTTDCWVNLGPDNTAFNGLAVGPSGLTNDAWWRGQVIVPCNNDGDIYYQIGSSGTGTFDLVINIWGYWM